MKILAAGQLISIEDLEVNPLKFGAALARAKAEHGFALCLCTAPNPQLVIRRARVGEGGDRFFLATWPNRGTAHGRSCRFHHSEDEYEEARAKRLAAIEEREDGFSIKADFSLLRKTAAPDEPEPARVHPDRNGVARPQRDTLGLLGMLEYLWRSAGLHKWSPGSLRNWTEVTTRLDSVRAQGNIGAQPMDGLLYLVPPFVPARKDDIAARFSAMLARYAPTPTATPSFLVLGEIRGVEDHGKTVLTHLAHHGRALFMFASLARALAVRYPAAEAQLGRFEGVEPDPERVARVIGLFLVEVTDKGNLWVRDAALMLCSRAYLPADSSHETRLANRLVNERRTFEKPIRSEPGDDVLPDFVLHDTGAKTVMEVWGMNTPEYQERKEQKRVLYSGRGEVLWEWDAWRDVAIPVLPAVVGRNGD